MEDQGRTEFVAECFWPGVQESDLAVLDMRASTTAVALSLQGDDVRYLGSLLMIDDEVVLCRFEGSEHSVCRVAQNAAIPYERIVKATRSRWHSAPPQ